MPDLLWESLLWVPALNPMENVWESYDNIIDACKTACNWLIAHPDRIRSIGTRDWATVNV